MLFSTRTFLPSPVSGSMPHCPISLLPNGGLLAIETRVRCRQLVGNKVDMSHLRAVKSERHTSLVDAHSMRSFFVSAKTGDNVSSTFFRVASELAGVTLTKPEVNLILSSTPSAWHPARTYPYSQCNKT